MQAASSDKKRNIIAGAIIAVCLIGGALGYYFMSAPSTSAADKQAQDSAAAKQAQMTADAQQNATPEPPPIERPVSRGPAKAK